MKKINLLNRLLSYSHEKQTPQRFARYAAILIMLLTIGVGQMWAWTTFYLAHDNDDCSMSTWSTSAYPFTSYSDGYSKLFIYAPTNMQFKFYTYNNSTDYWRGNGNTNIDNGWSGEQIKSNGDNMKYVGDPGIVEIHVQQKDKGNEDPYVWFASKPSIYIRHNWNNGGASNQSMSDEDTDGIYEYTGVYGGSNTSYVGPCSDCSSGSASFKTLTATLVGSPVLGNKCIFEYNSCGYASVGTTSQNTGSLTITKLCSISYDANGATSGDAPSSQSDLKYNVSMTLASNSGSLVKSGYSFTGWNTKADGSGYHYAASGSFTPSDYSTTLYAEWTPDWALYNLSTKLADFEKISSTEYHLSIDLSTTTHLTLQFKKDGTQGYIVGAEDPTSTFRNLTLSSGYFSWANIPGVTTASYFITLTTVFPR